MIKTIRLIEQWGYDRNLNTADPLMQTTKTLEEVIELQQAIIKYNKSLYSKDYNVRVMPYEEFAVEKVKHLAEIKDAIGDIFVTLVMLSLQDKDMDFIKIFNKGKNFFKTCVKTDIDLSLSYSRFIANQILTYQDYIASGRKGFYGELSDVIFTLMEIARNYKTTLKECVEHAYNEIKDRRGKMINGLWVKEQ